MFSSGYLSIFPWWAKIMIHSPEIHGSLCFPPDFFSKEKPMMGPQQRKFSTVHRSLWDDLKLRRGFGSNASIGSIGAIYYYQYIGIYDINMISGISLSIYIASIGPPLLHSIVPSGKHTQSYWKWPFSSWIYPFKNGGSFQLAM